MPKTVQFKPKKASPKERSWIEDDPPKYRAGRDDIDVVMTEPWKDRRSSPKRQPDMIGFPTGSDARRFRHPVAWGFRERDSSLTVQLLGIPARSDTVVLVPVDQVDAWKCGSGKGQAGSQQSGRKPDWHLYARPPVAGLEMQEIGAAWSNPDGTVWMQPSYFPLYDPVLIVRRVQAMANRPAQAARRLNRR